MDILHFALGTATIAGCFFSYHRGWNAGSQSERQKYLPAHVNQFETEGSLKRERDEAGYDLLYRYACAVEEYNEKNPGSDLKAYDDMFERTDTRWAPWTVIDGNNKKAARLSALTAIADSLEKGVSMKPLPADPEIVSLAEAALGAPIVDRASEDD
mgnify:CR=1 FL=1